MLKLSLIIQEAIRLHNFRQTIADTKKMMEAPDAEPRFGEGTLYFAKRAEEEIVQFFKDNNIEIDDTDVQKWLRILNEEETADDEEEGE